MGSAASAANMNVLPKVNVSQPPPPHTHTFPAVRLAVNPSLPSIFPPSSDHRPPPVLPLHDVGASIFPERRLPEGLPPGYLTAIILHLLSCGRAFLSASHGHRSRRGVDLSRGVREEEEEGLERMK